MKLYETVPMTLDEQASERLGVRIPPVPDAAAWCRSRAMVVRGQATPVGVVATGFMADLRHAIGLERTADWYDRMESDFRKDRA